MQTAQAIDLIQELLASSDTETANTSMRISSKLRQAAVIAVEELGVAMSTTALTTAALRAELEAMAVQAALDCHYEQYPQVRPSLAELAIAAAELDGHPLSKDPERLREAAAEVIERHPEAPADDVVLWAEAQSAIST